MIRCVLVMGGCPIWNVTVMLYESKVHGDLTNRYIIEVVLVGGLRREVIIPHSRMNKACSKALVTHF